MMFKVIPSLLKSEWKTLHTLKFALHQRCLPLPRRFDCTLSLAAYMEVSFQNEYNLIAANIYALLDIALESGHSWT